MQPVRIQPLTPDLFLYIIFGKATVTEHFKNPSYTKANRDTRQRTHAAVILRSPCFGQPLLQPIKSEGKRNEKENKPAVSVASDTGANCKPAAISAAAANDVARLPDVTPEMSDASYWADRQKGSRSVILTPEEIRAYNQDTAAAEGTMVTDLKSAGTTFNGLERDKEVLASAESDAEYYFGWTYLGSSEKATWPEFEKLIRNCSDPKAATSMRVRYGIAVNRTVLRVFPSDTPIWDDPADTDFDYGSVSAVAVNAPILIYTTSADGKYYLARTEDRSGWISAEDVAICSNRAEWLSAWDLPSQQLLVVYGNKVYTDPPGYGPADADAGDGAGAGNGFTAGSAGKQPLPFP